PGRDGVRVGERPGRGAAVARHARTWCSSRPVAAAGNARLGFASTARCCPEGSAHGGRAMNLRSGLMGFLACMGLALPVAAQTETEALLDAMREGGVVLLIRHSDTESGIGDPPGFSLRD